jgi:hypothetical protein
VLTIALRLGDGNRIVQLGEEWLLFVGKVQRAFSLNPAALYLSDRLEAGATREQLVAGLCSAGHDREPAVRATDAFLAELSDLNALHCSIESSSDGDAPDPLHVSIGGITFLLRFWDVRLKREFCALFDQPANASPSGEVVIIDIVREGETVFWAHEGGPGGAAPVRLAVTNLRNLMLKHLLERSDEVALHAACLARNGETLLLCGAPGAGKSTLTLALLQSGFAYLGDDVTFVDERGEVRALPFPLTIKEGSWPIVRQLDIEPDNLPTWNRADGQRVKYVPTPSPNQYERRPVRAIVSLMRGAAGEPSIQPRPKLDQLRALLTEGYAASGKASPDAFTGLVKLANTASCAELHYSDVQRAAQLLRDWYDG